MTTLAEKLEEYLEAQPQAHVKLNVAMRWLRAGVPQYRVVDRDLTAPPGSPTDGGLYIIAATATGDWAGHDGEFALYYSDLWGTNGWDFVEPVEGDTCWVADENVHLVYNGSTWGAV